MRRNPKYRLAPRLAAAVRLYQADGLEWIALGLEQRSGRTEIVPYPNDYGSGRRAPLAVLDMRRRRVLVHARSARLLPTTVHWLVALGDALPELGDYEVAYRIGGWNVDPEPSGYALEDVRARSASVTEEAYSEWPEAEGLRPYDYRALPPLEGMTLYHATLASRVPSIERRGLLPSTLGEGRIEGWSPGWNMGLQDAVYLFVDPEMAIRVALELSSRAYEDAVVLAVSGAGLSDTRLRVPDEDALRSAIDDSVLPHDWDRDFPPWVTSAESRTQSLGYAERIAPSHVSLWLLLKWAPEWWEEDGEERGEPGWELEGTPEGLRVADALLSA